MNRIVVVAVAFLALSATSSAAQERGNLARPYRFRLPFLEKGEYVVSAFGGNTFREFGTTFEDAGVHSASKSNTTWFDVNGVVALSHRFLVGVEFTVYPSRTTQEFELTPGRFNEAFEFEDEVGTHVAQEYTIVYRPIERFEIFAYYFRDTPEWNRTNSVADLGNVIAYDTNFQDFRAGITYFGKF